MRRKGFSLIEAAIVLGVVGLVIGGIWVAAATVYRNHRLNQTVAGIGVIYRNTRNLFDTTFSSNIFLSTFTNGNTGLLPSILDGADGFLMSPTGLVSSPLIDTQPL